MIVQDVEIFTEKVCISSPEVVLEKIRCGPSMMEQPGTRHGGFPAGTRILHH